MKAFLYRVFQQSNDAYLLGNSVELRQRLALRASRLYVQEKNVCHSGIDGGENSAYGREVTAQKLAADRALKAFDDEVSKAHARWCKYVGTPRFYESPRTLVAS